MNEGDPRVKKLIQAAGSVTDAEYNLGLKFEELEAVLHDLPGPVPDDWGDRLTTAWAEVREMRAYLAEEVRSLQRRVRQVTGDE